MCNLLEYSLALTWDTLLEGEQLLVLCLPLFLILPLLSAEGFLPPAEAQAGLKQRGQTRRPYLPWPICIEGWTKAAIP